MEKLRYIADETGLEREYIEVRRKAEVGEIVMAISCGYEGFWYKDKIGTIFEVVDGRDYGRDRSHGEYYAYVKPLGNDADNLYFIVDYAYNVLVPTDSIAEGITIPAHDHDSIPKQLTLKIRKLNEHATIPTYAHRTDAGFDLYASEDFIIEPGETAVVPTGLAMSVPEGYELQIRPRSGITSRTKLRIQLGTIDAGYHGEIGVIVDNIREEDDAQDHWTEYLVTVDGTHQLADDMYEWGSYIIEKGDRIAQAVLAPIVQASFVEVDALDESERNGNGFGSTGVTERKGAE